MSKVYIVNKGGHDHSDAERFGDLVFLSEGSINRYAVNQIYRQFNEFLRNSSTGDYIVPTGLTFMSIVACSIFAHKHGRLNLLIYKNKKSENENPYYVERILILEGD